MGLDMDGTEHYAMANQIRDALTRWLKRHRKLCSGIDCDEPYNILAFLCHSVGLRSTDLSELAASMADYEADCKCCSHLRN